MPHVAASERKLDAGIKVAVRRDVAGGVPGAAWQGLLDTALAEYAS